MSKATVERAFELARGGICRNVVDIRRALEREGYENCAEHLASASLKTQLKVAIRSCVAAPHNVDVRSLKEAR